MAKATEKAEDLKDLEAMRRPSRLFAEPRGGGQAAWNAWHSGQTPEADERLRAALDAYFKARESQGTEGGRAAFVAAYDGFKWKDKK